MKSKEKFKFFYKGSTVLILKELLGLPVYKEREYFEEFQGWGNNTRGECKSQRNVLLKEMEEIDTGRFLGVHKSGDAPRKKHFGG
jgi:hypothetical protein